MFVKWEKKEEAFVGYDSRQELNKNCIPSPESHYTPSDSLLALSTFLFPTGFHGGPWSHDNKRNPSPPPPTFLNLYTQANMFKPSHLHELVDGNIIRPEHA